MKMHRLTVQFALLLLSLTPTSPTMTKNWENSILEQNNVVQRLPSLSNSFSMLSKPQVYVMNVMETQVLECEFDAGYFNLFDNPVLWTKRQRDEATQLAVFRKISDPFVHTGRFESSFSPSPPRFTFELAVLELSLEDSGNYSCEVYGENNEVLVSVTHSIFVRSKVELTYITSGNETDFTEKPDMLHFTELQPSTLRCISMGGYPPPEMIVSVGQREITPELTLTEHTQLLGARGLRVISTTTERWTHSFLPLADDDGKEATCIVRVNGHLDEIETVPLSVNYAPVIKCRSSHVALGDVNVHLRCEVRARPSVGTLFWIIDQDGTKVDEDGIVNEVFWSLVKQIGNGVLETKLYIREATPAVFRTYTVVAGNSVSQSTGDATLKRKIKKHPTKPESTKGAPEQPDAARRSNGGYSNRRNDGGGAGAVWRHRLGSVLVACTLSALWCMTR